MSTFDDPNREAVGLPPIWTTEEAPVLRPSKTPKAARQPATAEVTTSEVTEGK